jgi:uncharacterized phage-associated protein
MKKMIWGIFLFLLTQNVFGSGDSRNLPQEDPLGLQKVLTKACEAEPFTEEEHPEASLLYGEFLFYNARSAEELTKAVNYVFKAAALDNSEAIHLVESITQKPYNASIKQFFLEKWPSYYSETLQIFQKTQLISAKDVALFLLYLTHQEESKEASISHLKLQKMLYFAQTCRVQFSNGPLFTEEIQAWSHGPVIEPVYQIYKEFKNNPIELSEAEYQKAELLSFSTEIKEFLKKMWKISFRHDAWDLRKITHSSSCPWQNIYQEGKNKVIDLYFLKFDKTSILKEFEEFLDNSLSESPKSKKIK